MIPGAAAVLYSAAPRLAGRALRARPHHLGGRMANSKSKHIRMKSRRRQQWKARKKRRAAAAKTAAKK